MYAVLASSGFTDSWRALRPGVDGLTCCHVADLSDQVARFDQRIDYVWTRGFARDDGKVKGSVDRFGQCAERPSPWARLSCLAWTTRACRILK